jgi:hypothetical protein
VKDDYGTKQEIRAMNGLEEPLKKKNILAIILCEICEHHAAKEIALEFG